ncbi:MAG: hypothetical protein LAO22_21715 [Acidobacteriia bacterium]|nr:hypothetical protein [Terriglobia bacterium]
MGSTELQPVVGGLIGGLFPPQLLDLDPRGDDQRMPPGSRSGGARPKSGQKPLLSGRDFILPELVSRTDNGDLSVSVGTATDGAHLGQVFRLAEHGEHALPMFSDLSYAEQQLERRRYLDYLKRKPKQESARAAKQEELEVWQRGGPEAEANFNSWWLRKQQRRQAAFSRKANRLANCRVSGRRMDCSDHPDEHCFYAEFRCQCRYCRQCGAQIFGELFGKYVGLWPTVVGLLPGPGHRSAVVIAKLDFTATNMGRMPRPQDIREFNQDVHECLKRVLCKLGIKSNQYGFLWCDEFGGWNSKMKSYNTNLHAHGVYVGPYLPQRVLAEIWAEIRAKRDGAKIVWISKQKIDAPPHDFLECQHRRFIRALGHALKYTGKHVSRSDGERLADLETAFHTVRRVHTMGLFYRAMLVCESPCAQCGSRCELVNGHHGEHQCRFCGHASRCPLCPGRLMFPRDSGYAPIADLKKEGRRELGEVQRQLKRERIFHGPRGPDEPVEYRKEAA